MSVLTVDFGGSHLGCALVADRAVLAERVLPVNVGASLRSVLPAMTAALRDCLREAAPAGDSVSGIAVGFCGLKQAVENCVVAVFDKFIDAPGFDWDGLAVSSFGLPLRLENDAQLALRGEVWAGAGQGAEDVVMITLGTGIGGAAMLGGVPLHSRAGQAGALGGHLSVNAEGRRCVCGAIGCAEAEASTVVLPTLCREQPGFAASALAAEPALHFEALFRCVDAGDGVAAEVLAHCLKVWSCLTVSLIHAYGPELVLFGGGVMRRAPDILPAVRDYVAAHLCRTLSGVPRIEAARLGRHAALLGGEALFAQRNAPARKASPDTERSFAGDLRHG